MKLNLQRIDNVKGIYGGTLPERMRYLHPEAAHAFEAIADWVVVSDMFRSPESSLRAVREGRGAQPPGYSAHNYGLAIDIDVNAALKLTKTKQALDEQMREKGWHCYRTDHKTGPRIVNGKKRRDESWHYNYLGDVDYPPGLKTTVELVERAILFWYGDQFEYDVAEAQRKLTSLRMYRGAIDGKLGPLSQEAIRVFQRAWGLRETGKLDAKTKRTLAYVAP